MGLIGNMMEADAASTRQQEALQRQQEQRQRLREEQERQQRLEAERKRELQQIEEARKQAEREQQILAERARQDTLYRTRLANPFQPGSFSESTWDAVSAREARDRARAANANCRRQAGGSPGLDDACADERAAVARYQKDHEDRMTETLRRSREERLAEEERRRRAGDADSRETYVERVQRIEREDRLRKAREEEDVNPFERVKTVVRDAKENLKDNLSELGNKVKKGVDCVKNPFSEDCAAQ